MTLHTFATPGGGGVLGGWGGRGGAAGVVPEPDPDEPDVPDASPRVPDGRCNLAHVPRLVEDHQADFLYVLVDSLFYLHGHILSSRIRLCQTPVKKGKIARMILACIGCLSQNFVSDVGREGRGDPPRCWKCGE